MQQDLVYRPLHGHRDEGRQAPPVHEPHDLKPSPQNPRKRHFNPDHRRSTLRAVQPVPRSLAPALVSVHPRRLPPQTARLPSLPPFLAHHGRRRARRPFVTPPVRVTRYRTLPLPAGSVREAPFSQPPGGGSTAAARRPGRRRPPYRRAARDVLSYLESQCARLLISFWRFFVGGRLAEKALGVFGILRNNGFERTLLREGLDERSGVLVERRRREMGGSSRASVAFGASRPRPDLPRVLLVAGRFVKK